MGKYTALVDRILESDDVLSVLREGKSYFIKTREEFLSALEELKKRFEKQGVKCELNAVENGPIQFVIERGYMNDPNSELFIQEFNDNAQVVCDKSKKCRVPGSTNLNKFTDANQILKMLDGYAYSFERETKKNEPEKEPEKEKTKEEQEDEAFEMDPAVKKIMDDLKSTGESMKNKVLSIETDFNGKKFKPSDAKLYSSTEREAVLIIEFPRDQELAIYDTIDSASQRLRNAIIKNFNQKGFKGKTNPAFRYDMDKNPYFYIPVGPLPVKNTKGPEARAILNYYDGNKVRFQPRSDD